MYCGGMRKGTIIRAAHIITFIGHHPTCQASRMSLVFEVPTVVKNMKKKNICPPMSRSLATTLLSVKVNHPLSNKKFWGPWRGYKTTAAEAQDSVWPHVIQASSATLQIVKGNITFVAVIAHHPRHDVGEEKEQTVDITSCHGGWTYACLTNASDSQAAVVCQTHLDPIPEPATLSFQLLESKLLWLLWFTIVTDFSSSCHLQVGTLGNMPFATYLWK